MPGEDEHAQRQLETLVLGLTSRNQAFAGLILTAEEYDEKHRDSAAAPSFEIQSTSPPKRNFLARLFGLTAKFKRPSLTLFRLPTSISSARLGTFVITAGVHNFFLALGQLSRDAVTSYPHIVLTSYFYSYLSNLDEILNLKAQGRTMVLDLNAPDGKQIQVKASNYYVLMANLVEEVILNSALSPVMEEGATPLDILQRSLLFGFAKTPVERACATLESQRRIALLAGDEKLAKRIEFKQLVIQNFFFNFVVPVLRTLEISAPKGPIKTACKIGSALVLGGVGCISIVEEIRERVKTRQTAKAAGVGNPCGRILVTLARQGA